MMHEPLPRRTVVQADVTITHVLHRDYRDPEPGRPEKGRRAQVRSRPVNRSSVCGIRRRRRSRAAVAPEATPFRRNSSKLRRIRAGS